MEPWFSLQCRIFRRLASLGRRLACLRRQLARLERSLSALIRPLLTRISQITKASALPAPDEERAAGSALLHPSPMTYVAKPKQSLHKP